MNREQSGGGFARPQRVAEARPSLDDVDGGFSSPAPVAARARRTASMRNRFGYCCSRTNKLPIIEIIPLTVAI